MNKVHFQLNFLAENYNNNSNNSSLYLLAKKFSGFEAFWELVVDDCSNDLCQEQCRHQHHGELRGWVMNWSISSNLTFFPQTICWRLMFQLVYFLGSNGGPLLWSGESPWEPCGWFGHWGGWGEEHIQVRPTIITLLGRVLFIRCALNLTKHF